MGNGNCFTERKILGLPVPPQRNFAYGICESPLSLTFAMKSPLACSSGSCLPISFFFIAVARPDRVRATLGDAWAGKDPNKVLQDSKFYTDILRRCHQVEMTLMLLTSRALPLAEARPAVEGALSESMQRLRGGEPLAEEDRHALTKFIKLFDGR